ncbi:MAG: hypothetical protein KF847_03200 [Pirellulales bacterium]|nr:hypothetical protein [Pirellulales bacterium]
MSRAAVEDVPLTSADYARFHKNAPAALARRGAGFAWEETVDALQRILFGALPIVGMLRWEWSGEAMFAFLIAGLWVGIACDAAKYCFLSSQAEAFAQSRYDDWHVWIVAGAIRDGTHRAPPAHLRAKWAPQSGVFVDFFLGGASTALLVILLVRSAGMGWADVAVPSVAIGLAVTAAVRIAGTIVEILQHRRADRAGFGVAPLKFADAERPVKCAVGLRGVALFLLLFPAAMIAESDSLRQSAPRLLMLGVNGLIVLSGLVNLAGPLLLRGETRWLRDYLARRDAELKITP